MLRCCRCGRHRGIRHQESTAQLRRPYASLSPLTHLAFGRPGTLLVNDAYMKEDGTPLHGFTFAVWASIFTNAAGGMIVATVMKFAGNILRNFAQACAIIVGGFGSWLLFDFVITARFVGGVALVCGLKPRRRAMPMMLPGSGLVIERHSLLSFESSP